MELLVDLVKQLRDLEGLVGAAVHVGITAIMLFETGLLLPFLSGGSPPVMAGLVAAVCDPLVNLNAWGLGALCSAAAIIAGRAPCMTGRRAGRALFNAEDSPWVRMSRLGLAAVAYRRLCGEAHSRSGAQRGEADHRIIILSFPPGNNGWWKPRLTRRNRTHSPETPRT